MNLKSLLYPTSAIILALSTVSCQKETQGISPECRNIQTEIFVRIRHLINLQDQKKLFENTKNLAVGNVILAKKILDLNIQIIELLVKQKPELYIIPIDSNNEILKSLLFANMLIDEAKRLNNNQVIKLVDDLSSTLSDNEMEYIDSILSEIEKNLEIFIENNEEIMNLIKNKKIEMELPELYQNMEKEIEKLKESLKSLKNKISELSCNL